ncbi:type II secretion system F family protein [Elusimicrobiota bacterium]
MPGFEYKARTAAGDIINGEMEASQQKDVAASLKEQNLMPLEINEKKANALADMLNKINPFKGRVKSKDLVIFSRQLATMVSAGVPIVQGLNILVEQIENPVFKDIVGKLREDIESGSAIADAMSKHPAAFSGLFVNMIKAGELGGILDTILERLAGFLESANDLKGKVKGALVYPAVVTVVAFTVTAFLMVFIIPSFENTFTSLGGELPLPTQIMIGISHIMQKYILFVIIAIIGSIIGVIQFYKTEYGSKKIDKIVLDLPVFGILLRKVAIAKFTRTFGTLIKSGVPILEALDTVALTSGNRVIEEAVLDAKESIREGEKIAEPLAKSGVFPPMVMQMISVGEETGNLDTMLSKIADFYDSEVDVAVEGLTSMIEPVIIVGMGLIIGAIVVAMFMPIFQMGSLIGG